MDKFRQRVFLFVGQHAVGYRLFRLDIEVCPKCGGKLRVIAAITQPDVIQKIMHHVHQQQAPPRQPPARVNGPITTEIQFDAS